MFDPLHAAQLHSVTTLYYFTSVADFTVFSCGHVILQLYSMCKLKITKTIDLFVGNQMKQHN